jgi:hypothetical protein
LKRQNELRRLIAQTGRRGQGSNRSNESARSSEENLDHDTSDSVAMPKLDRRVSVAPMMDWSDEVQFVF